MDLEIEFMAPAVRSLLLGIRMRIIVSPSDMSLQMSFKIVIDDIILFLYALTKAGSLVSVQNKSSSNLLHYNLLGMHVTFDLYCLKERCLPSFRSK